MVACPYCIGGYYRAFKDGWVDERCGECLGMGNLPRVTDPRMRGTIIVGEEVRPSEIAITDAPITMNTLKVLSKTPTVPERYQGRPADMLAAALKGRELGVQPMEAISSIYLVNGRASIEGKLMVGLILQAGHIIKVKPSDEEAVVTGMRWHEQSKQLIDMGEIRFTWEDAKRASLDKKDTYKQYPQFMLAWRAITWAARLWFADVISGIGYTPDEIGVDAPVEEIPDEIIDDELEEAEVVNE